jgi:hypothetical protein
MTDPNEQPITVGGDGEMTTFPFGFEGDGPSDITVTYVDQFGNETPLKRGPAPDQYRVEFSTLVPGQTVTLLGSVTYAPNGIPIPPGTALAIVRTEVTK